MSHALCARCLLSIADLTCFYHPHRVATDQCDRCGDYLCESCVFEFQKQHLCKRCQREVSRPELPIRLQAAGLLTVCATILLGTHLFESAWDWLPRVTPVALLAVAACSVSSWRHVKGLPRRIVIALLLFSVGGIVFTATLELEDPLSTATFAVVALRAAVFAFVCCYSACIITYKPAEAQTRPMWVTAIVGLVPIVFAMMIIDVLAGRLEGVGATLPAELLGCVGVSFLVGMACYSAWQHWRHPRKPPL